MKILIVSSFLPYPLHSGGHVRLYNLIKELSNRHEITLFCEKRPNQTVEEIKAVEKICRKVITVDRRRQWSLENILKSAISVHSFLINGHTHQKMKYLLKRELENVKYDLIHIETFYVMQNLSHTNIPKILVEHNIEYKVYKKFLSRAPHIFRPLLVLDVVKIKREEERFWKKADRLVVVSEADRRVIRTAGFDADIVANGVDIEKFAYKQKAINDKQKERKILFIGDFKWIQNRDSVKFIIEEIWPLIKQKIKSNEQKVNLWIVAREIPQSVRKLSEDNDVIFDEKSSGLSTEKIFQAADVLLAPIRVGGGTSYKILESMSCGTPVVTTKMSANSLGAKDNEDIMASDEPIDLATKTINLLEDEKLYEKISKKGRKLVEEKYTWKEIAKKLNGVYESVRK